MITRFVAALALMASLSGCTTWDWFAEREDQELIVKTDPAGAQCTFHRNGVRIAELSPTPGAIYIHKTSDDILVTCHKDGYQTSSLLNESGSNGATVLRVVMFGPLDWIGESIAGIDNKYDHVVTLPLPGDETRTSIPQ